MKALWENTDPNDIDNFIHFMESFLSFDHTSIDGGVKGHPTDMLHRISLLFFGEIDVIIDGGDSMSADQYLFNIMKSTRLAASVFSISIPALSVVDISSSSGKKWCLTKDTRRFLLLSLMMGKLFKWDHNKEMIVRFFGNSFYLVIHAVLKFLTHKIEELDQLWRDANMVPNNYAFTLIYFNITIALVQIQLGFGKVEHDHMLIYYHIPNVPFPQLSIQDLQSLDIDVLGMNIVLLEDNDNMMPRNSSYNSQSIGKARKSTAVKQKKLDDVMSSAVPIMTSLILSTSQIMRTMSLFLRSSTSGRVSPNSNNTGIYGGEIPLSNDFMVRASVRLGIILHTECCFACSSILTAKPTLLNEFKLCQISDAMTGLYNIKDFISMSSDNKFMNLLVQSHMICMYFHYCGLHAAKQFKQPSYLDELVTCISCLEFTFAMLVELTKQNASMKMVNPSCDMISELCCYQDKFRLLLPSADLYPWTASSTTPIMFRTKMTSAEYDFSAAFTEPLIKYWKIRTVFFPVDHRHIFEPTKSFLGNLLSIDMLGTIPRFYQLNDINAENPFIAMMGLKGAQLIHHLYSIVFHIMEFMVQDGYELHEISNLMSEILKTSLRILKHSGTFSFGEVGLTLMLIFFYLQAFESCPAEVILATRNVSFWKEFLTIVLPQKNDENNIDPFLNKFVCVFQKNEFEAGIQLKKEYCQAENFMSGSSDTPTSSSAVNSSHLPNHNKVPTDQRTKLEQEFGLPYFKYRLFMMDCTFELLWLVCSYQSLPTNQPHSTALHSLQNNNPVKFDEEDWVLLDCISNSSCDCAVYLCFNWLCNLAQLHSGLGLNPPLWSEVLRKSMTVLKHLSDSSFSSTSGSTRESISKELKRPFLWPSRVVILRLIGRLFYDYNFRDWSEVFTKPATSLGDSLSMIPKSSTVIGDTNENTPRAESLKVNAKNTRHLLLFRLVLDARCRDFAVALVLRLLYSAIVQVVRIKEETDVKAHSVTFAEALAHDMIKCTFNIIKSHAQQLQGQDGVGASRALLQGFMVLLRDPRIFAGESEYQLSLNHIQKVFMSFGPATAVHKNFFSWSRSRLNIMKDLVVCLDGSVISACGGDESIVAKQRELLFVAMSYLTALMQDCEHLQEMLRGLNSQRRKKSLSHFLKKLDIHGSHHDLLIVIKQYLGGTTQTVEVIAVLLEMLLNGLPANLKDLFKVAIKERVVDLPEAGLFEDLSAVPLIRNPVSLCLIFPLISSWTPKTQLCVLHTIIQLFQGRWTAIINLTSVSTIKPSLIDLILDNFRYIGADLKPKCILLLQLLGKFSITVAELKRVIRTLKEADAEIDLGGDDRNVQIVTDSKKGWYLIETLRGTLIDEDDPQFFYLFEGRSCGILVPPFQRWPGYNGYTFCTWFSLKDWGSANFKQEEDSKLTLFSVRQLNGVGFDIFAKPRVGGSKLLIDFFVTITTAKNTPPIEKALCCLNLAGNNNKASSWHFFAVSHAKGRFMGKSFITAFIDNDNPCKIELSFPKLADATTLAGIGCVHYMNEEQQGINHHNGSSPNSHSSEWMSFHGRMSAVYLFSEALSVPVLQQMQKLGYTKIHEITSNLDDFRNLGLDTNVHNALVLAYNPGMHRGSIVVDMAEQQSLSNGHKWQVIESFIDPEAIHSLGTSSLGSAMNGKLLDGTHVCTSRDMRNALDCLGGIKVILPIFENLSICQTPEETASRYAQILQLFISTLRNSVENKTFMANQGFAYLINFLTLLEPHQVTLEIVDGFISLLEKFQNDQEWVISCITTIFFDFNFWSTTPFICQETILKKLCNYVSSHADLVKSRIGFTKLFDALYLCYANSFQLNQRLSMLARGEMPITLLRAQSIKWDMGELVTIRGLVFNVLYVALSNTTQPIDKEIQALVRYIHYESDPQFKIYALQWFVKLINPEKIDLARKMIEAMSTARSLFVLCELAGHNNAKVRLHAWLAVCSTLYLALSFAGVQFTVSIDGVNSGNNTASSGGYYGSTANPVATAGSDFTATGSLYGANNSYGVFSWGSREVDAFGMLGVDLTTLSPWLLELFARSHEAINSDAASTSQVDGSESHFPASSSNPSIELYLLFQILQLTFFGRSCKIIIPLIEKKLSSPLSRNESNSNKSNSGDAQQQFPDDNRQISSSEVVVDTLEEEDFDTIRMISFPMLFPALIQVLKSSFIDIDSKIRLFSKITKHLLGQENNDIFLSIPKWQSYLLELVCTTLIDERFQNDFDFINCKHFRDFIATIFGKLHVHGILYGELRLPRHRIEAPGVIRPLDYLELSARDIFELMRRDQRTLGSGLVRKTIGYIRCYVAKGLIDWRDFGVEILHKIMNMLNDTLEYIRQADLDVMEKTLRLKLHELNVWLLVEGVCEFIALPPSQPAHSSTHQPMMKSTASFNNLSSLQVARSEAEPVSSGLPSMAQTIQSVKFDENNVTESSKVGMMPVNLSELDDGVIDDHFAADGRPFYVEQVNRTFSPELMEDDDLLHELQLNLMDDSLYVMETEQEKFLWALIDSMIALLGLDDKGTTAWYNQDRSKRLGAAIRVGVARGRYVIHVIQESTESMIGNDGETSTTSSNNNNPKGISDRNNPKQQKYILDKIINHSMWILLRIILNVALLGANHPIHSEDRDSLCIKALIQLTNILNWSKNIGKGDYHQESLLVLGKLSIAINKATTSRHTLWMKLAMKLLLEIIANHKKFLANGIIAQSKGFMEPKPGRFSVGGLRPQYAPIDFGSLGDFNDDRFMRYSLRMSFSSTSTGSRRESFSEDSPPSSGLTDYLEQKIVSTLELPGDVRFFWMDWENFMEQVMKTSMEKEKIILLSRLDEMGLHKQSVEISTQLEVYFRALDDAKSFFKQRIDASVVKIGSIEVKQLKDAVRIETMNKKTVFKDWKQLLGDLSNERGAWGNGDIVEEQDNVSVIYDILYSTLIDDSLLRYSG